MSATLVRWTVADYHTMIAAGLFLQRRVELLNGLILEMSPESPLHSDLSRDTGDLFREALGDRARISENKPIRLSNDSEPEPDVAVIRRKSYRETHPTPDDVFLVIEFANTSLAKDTEEKRQTYADANIQDYWVVDLKNRQLIVYRNPSHADYQSEQRYTSGSISPLAFPDIAIAVQSLLD